MERELFDRYAAQYKDTVYRVALNYYGSSQDAEDTVQEVLLRLYTADTDFESGDHVRRWLIRVTLNLCKNTMRWYARRRQVPMEEVDISFREAEQSDLFQTVMALPEKYRTVLYLFYYEEYTVKEIAQLLHITVSAATTRLSRARDMLRKQLTEVGTDGR